MGWRRPHQQHDVVELADFLIPRLTDAVRFCWEARCFLQGGLRRTEEGTLGSCLSLSGIAPTSHQIQDLIQQWHLQQSAMHALVHEPPWLFVQLPRAQLSDQGPCKRNEAYIFPDELLLPLFVGQETLNVRWASYEVKAYITHHGEHLETGHYRTLVREGNSFWLQDDARKAAKASDLQLDEASTCMYLLLLISKKAVRTPANLASSSNLDSQRSPDGRSRSTEPECELVDGAPLSRPSTATDDAGRSDRAAEGSDPGDKATAEYNGAASTSHRSATTDKEQDSYSSGLSALT